MNNNTTVTGQRRIRRLAEIFIEACRSDRVAHLFSGNGFHLNKRELKRVYERGAPEGFVSFDGYKRKVKKDKRVKRGGGKAQKHVASLK